MTRNRITALILVLTAAFGLTATTAVAGTVKVANYEFRPKVLEVDKGEKITWKGVRGSHDVTFERSPFTRRKFHRNVFEGRRFSKRARRDGRFRYVCTFHDHLGMRGKIVVE
jgi:plastocyanin